MEARAEHVAFYVESHFPKKAFELALIEPEVRKRIPSTMIVALILLNPSNIDVGLQEIQSRASKYGLIQKVQISQCLLRFLDQTNTNEDVEYNLLGILEKFATDSPDILDYFLSHPFILKKFTSTSKSSLIINFIVKAGQTNGILVPQYLTKVVDTITSSMENGQMMDLEYLTFLDQASILMTLLERAFQSKLPCASVSSLVVSILKRLDVFELESFDTKVLQNMFDHVLKANSTFCGSLFEFLSSSCFHRVAQNSMIWFSSLNSSTFVGLLNSLEEQKIRVACLVSRQSFLHCQYLMEWLNSNKKKVSVGLLPDILKATRSYAFVMEQSQPQWRAGQSDESIKTIIYIVKHSLDVLLENCNAALAGKAEANIDHLDLLDIALFIKEEKVKKQLSHSLYQVPDSLMIQAQTLSRLYPFFIKIGLQIFIPIFVSSYTYFIDANLTDKDSNAPIYGEIADKLSNKTCQTSPLLKPIDDAIKKTASERVLCKYSLRVVDALMSVVKDENWAFGQVLFDSILRVFTFQKEIVQKELGELLISLVKKLLNKYPSRYNISDLAIALLKSYSGSLSRLDQSILSILYSFEETDYSIMNHVRNWGVTDQVASVNKFDDVLNRIESNTMASSIHLFPFERNIDAIHTIFPVRTDKETIYDPAFFLPLAANLLSDTTSFDLHRFVESNLLGLAIMAMASHCCETRKAGHFITYKTYNALIDSELKERNQILLLLRTFRDGMFFENIEQPDPIPSIIGSFVAQSVMILLKPESDLYPTINQFCLQRPTLDLNDIPLFYNLLYSHTDLHKRERSWLLRLLLNGMNSKEVKCFDPRTMHCINVVMY